MPSFSINVRETGLVEHVCSQHGVGHPNFYSAMRLNRYENTHANHWLTHGCCGCCKAEDFPGRRKSDDEILSDLYQQEFDTGEDSFEEYRIRAFAVHDLGVNALLRDYMR